MTFALNYYLTEVKKVKCSFIGIDISEAVIQKSKSIAQTLGYRNMDFLRYGYT
ncbi:methyltransferase [Clostridium acetobutylicum]|uniref:methyltransferase n=1 Tax=Clostridium acetobutylicum TaxID=1488 RepID=UPI00285276BF|nr:methyltransferase [Clostridium acetobutylicum]